MEGKKNEKNGRRRRDGIGRKKKGKRGDRKVKDWEEVMKRGERAGAQRMERADEKQEGEEEREKR